MLCGLFSHQNKHQPLNFKILVHSCAPKPIVFHAAVIWSLIHTQNHQYLQNQWSQVLEIYTEVALHMCTHRVKILALYYLWFQSYCKCLLPTKNSYRKMQYLNKYQ